MAGLTAAAYLGRAGVPAVLLEKEPGLGGLVGSFSRSGFTFDWGLRAVEDSGIVFPMLRQLGVDLPFLANPVSVGIGGERVDIDGPDSLPRYGAFLARLFPGSSADVGRIMAEIRRVMGLMDVLYGIDNPLFLDRPYGRDYLAKTLLPWLLRYVASIGRVERLGMPVEERLAALTSDRRLSDMVAQHFFRATPAFFALSYFSLYLGYSYPKGGTGSLPSAVADYARARGVRVATGTRAASVDLDARVVRDGAGGEWPYAALVWAADQKAFYRCVDAAALRRPGDRRRLERRRAAIEPLSGGQSVFSLYLGVDLPPERFAARSSPHFFFTPSSEGLSSLGPAPGAEAGWAAFEAWLSRFCALNTYEISIPCLRDPSLAPPGKTGLVVSLLFDHAVARRAANSGWEKPFSEAMERRMLAALESAYPGIGAAASLVLSSSPLSIERRVGSTDGAITGWAFDNPVVPAVHSMGRITRSVDTPFRGVYQAGMWSFSPSGLPISILTGKLAAEAAAKEARRR